MGALWAREGNATWLKETRNGDFDNLTQRGHVAREAAYRSRQTLPLLGPSEPRSIHSAFEGTQRWSFLTAQAAITLKETASLFHPVLEMAPSLSFCSSGFCNWDWVDSMKQKSWCDPHPPILTPYSVRHNLAYPSRCPLTLLYLSCYPMFLKCCDSS